MLPEGVFQRDAPGMEEGEERHHHSPAALDTVMNPKLSPNPRISRNFGQGKHPQQKICREILSIITQNNMKYAPKKKKSQPCSVSLRANSHSALYKTVLSKTLDPNFRGLPRPRVELEKSNSVYVMQIFNAKHFAGLGRNDHFHGSQCCLYICSI